MCTRWRHRLEERPEHLAALVADVAHHLQLLVDDHEELVDLLLVGAGTPAAAPCARRGRRRPASRKVPLIGFIRTSPPCTDDVPLGARADQVAVAGEEAEGPVGAALALEQPAEDGQRLGGVPVGDLRAVVPADDEVGALALADLVADDRLDQLGVRPRRRCRSRRGRRTRRRCRRASPSTTSSTRDLELGLDVDHDQRRAVVVGLEPALADLPEPRRGKRGRPPSRSRGPVRMERRDTRSRGSGRPRRAGASARSRRETVRRACP